MTEKEKLKEQVESLANEAEKNLAVAGRSGNFYAETRANILLEAYAKVLALIEEMGR